MADANLSLPIRTEANGDIATKVVDATIVSQGLAVTTGGRAKVLAAGATAGGVETNIKTDSAGAVFVVLAEATGGAVADYQTSASLAATASINHDYTAVNTFTLQGLIISSSARLKVEIKTGPVGSLVSKAVLWTSTASPTIIADSLTPTITVASTNIIRFVITNEDKAAADVYSTRLGTDI